MRFVLNTPKHHSHSRLIKQICSIHFTSDILETQKIDFFNTLVTVKQTSATEVLSKNKIKPRLRESQASLREDPRLPGTVPGPQGLAQTASSSGAGRKLTAADSAPRRTPPPAPPAGRVFQEAPAAHNPGFGAKDQSRFHSNITLGKELRFSGLKFLPLSNGEGSFLHFRALRGRRNKIMCIKLYLAQPLTQDGSLINVFVVVIYREPSEV